MEFVLISVYPFDSVIFSGLNWVDSFCTIDSVRISCDQTACNVKLITLADS